MSATAPEVTSGDMAAKLILVLISAPLTVLTLIGNLTIILIWFTRAPIRTPQNAYFISLAFVDLLTGSFAYPLTLVFGYRRQWDFGRVMCRLYLITYFPLTAMSAYHLVAVAADRYRCVTEGVSYMQRRSMKSVVEKLVIIWVLGIWVGAPLILDWDNTTVEVDPSGQKKCISKKTPFWVTHVWFTCYGFPAFLIIRIYWKVFLEIRKRLGLRKDVETNYASTTTNFDTEEKTDDATLSVSQPGNRTSQNFTLTEVSEAKRQKNLAKERKSAITLGIIIGAFLICWAPWYFLTLYDVLAPLEYKPPTYLYQFVTTLGLANSCFNPIVYAARVPEFQVAFRRIYNPILKLFGRPTNKM